MMDARQCLRRKLTQALAQLSDAEWLQVRRDEDRRRAEQRTIRDLSKLHRELRDRKRSPLFATMEKTP